MQDLEELLDTARRLAHASLTLDAAVTAPHAPAGGQPAHAAVGQR